GCKHVNTALPCNDGRYCTTNATCSGGVCVGSARDCSDSNICTDDACDEAHATCVHTPSHACGVEGTVHYYRDDSGAGFEPSAKAVPNVDIDDSGDANADATTDIDGSYAFSGVAGNVTVRTLSKYGSAGASDDNHAVTSFDAVLIGRHSVH